MTWVELSSLQKKVANWVNGSVRISLIEIACLNETIMSHKGD